MPMICYWAGELGEGERNQNQEHDTKKENLRHWEHGRGDPGTAGAPPGAEEDQPAWGSRGRSQDVPLQPRRCRHIGASLPPCPVPRTVPNHSRSAQAPSRVPRTGTTSRLQVRIHLSANGSGERTRKSRQPGCSSGAVAQRWGSGSPGWLMAGPGPWGQGTARM